MDDIDQRLEQRLRADAARPDGIAVPSLDSALNTALGRRAPAGGWLAAAAAVIVLAGGAVVLTLRSGGDDHSAPAAPVPSISGVPLHRGHQVLREIGDYGIDTVFRVPSDPAALDVLVPYSRQTGACSLFAARVSLVRQSATQVRLAAAGYVYVDEKPAYEKNVGFSCFEGNTRVVRVRLDAPLGDRTVFGDAAGDARARIVDPADVPAVSYVPAGYRLVQQMLPSAKSGATTASRLYRKGDAELDIDTADTSLDQPTPTSPVVGHADVHGHRAAIVGDGNERCVSWNASGGRPRAVCSLANPLLSSTELLKVARGLT